MKNPYEILGVSNTATQDEIKKAYRTLAKKLHPDLNPGNKGAEARFKDVTAAYQLVGTEEARGKYDRGETEEQMQQRARDQASYYQSQQGGGRYSQGYGGFDFEDSDFFENIFRNAGSGPQGRRWSTQQGNDHPGEDHLYKMEVDFKDAVLGAEREITLPTGKKLLVKIPAGIQSGAKLRFKNQGGPGVGKGPTGHAFVEISVRPDKNFTRVGNNIETELPISFQEGLLGAEVKVSTIDGQVMLKIPAGSSTGNRLRISGKGVLAGEKRGDQIVHLKVVLPKDVNPDLQEALRKLGPQFDYNPRSEA